jgi:RsmE family RNA methyltransferase
LDVTFVWGEPAPLLDPITVIVGLPRPQTARKILHEVTALGVEAIHFVSVEMGDPGYAQSKLWTTGEWRRHVMLGAEQSFNPRLPAVFFGQSLAAVLEALPVGCRVALDNYESALSLGQTEIALPLTLAVGPERGWAAEERDLLRSEGFALSHMGQRVLRVETACVAALAITRSRLDLI